MKINNIIRSMIDYDAEKGSLTWSKHAPAKVRGKAAGTLNKTGYIYICISYKRLRAHRVAYFLFYGYWPPGIIDHKNGCKTDNSIRNLRSCKNYQNQGNKVKSEGKSSKFKGVCWDKSRGKWLASITIGDKSKYLGRFSSEMDAAMAYKVAARDYFGEFMKTPGVDDGAF